MIAVVPLLSCHGDGFELQDGQFELKDEIISDGYWEMLESLPNSYAATKDGVVIGFFGLAPQSGHRALGWALIGKNCVPSDFVKFTKGVREYIDASGFKRVEIVIRDGFQNGHRWAKMLGFHCETPRPMLNWFKGGVGAFLYSRCYE